ncbi:MAG: peptide ABC transporter substrate-binding protein [Clostridia bacterium]
MKKVLAMVLALTMLLGCVTMAVAEEAGKTISVFYGGGTPLSIDPALNSASSGSNVLKLAFAGLMGYQPVDGVPTLSPELAESYTVTDDKLVYTFTLRDGLKWSDGTDLKASEVAASWNRAASVDLGADYGFLYSYVDGYNNGAGPLNIVTDDAARTFTVTLANPTSYFLNLCAFPTFYPVKTAIADNEGAWATKPETYIGTGAFRMTKYAVDDVISFEKNPNYWNASAVSLGGVNCYLSEDNVAILTAFENDTAQFINAIDPTEYERLYASYPGQLVMGDYIGTWYILFNVHKDISPSTKQLTIQEQSKARFALGQMINRKDLVEYVTMGGQEPATGFYPKSLSDGLNADVRVAEGYSSWYTGTATPSAVNENYTEDMVTALQTLVDLGYPHTGTIEGGDVVFTDFPSIEFAFNNSGANAAIMQYVQETWNQVGITGTINTEAWATLQEKLKKGDAESARMGWIADFNDCVNFLEIFVSASGNNYPRLGKDLGDYKRNTEATKDAGLGAYWGPNGDQTWADCFDALVDKVKACTDPAERAKLCAEAENILMATGSVAPMYFYTNPYMLKPNVKNLMLLSTGDALWTYATVE